ncbi:uncharacterized protein BDW43DRAFT_300541 [Aspergillus alliaceus]|uniref:uncharacterized protein n=1 Tax=Petromyces alliaceus TaxID=209559 RepID=UPI0012A66CF4|nr:ASST-domain-containing protein [Aspergillus alliaceus]KAB8233076.1 ASST-domain-containing protein [Aspergillus alliaceus]
MILYIYIVAWLQLALSVVAQLSSDGDLMSFVTLPGVRALKYEVYYKDRDRVSPGYWFVAPYGNIDPEPPSQQYKPYQIGPYIYDGDGMLIWAGSPMFDNRNVFDFKAVHSIGNKPHLSLVWQFAYDKSDNGHGVILDNGYNIRKKIPMPNEYGAFDIHEFNVLDDGRTAMAINYREHEIALDTLDRPGEHTHVLSGGFAQLDLRTEQITYLWDGIDKIALSESVAINKEYPAVGPPGWDYVHINSIDKNDHGDYIISYRFTNTIYMVSGQDGAIMWRLGGQFSDFEQDFTFSKQHDAKFIESNGTHHIISLLNNASDEQSNDEDVSSALFVELDTTTSPKTARVIRRHNRPDGGLTRLRGNAQLLPNNNAFVGWSERGYISEFSPEGDVLLNANFVSSRYSTYRAYKFAFTGRPSAPPDLVSSVWGTDQTDLTTIFYVSWNGATDVAGWNFYARAARNGHPVLVGNATKTDFETMFIARGYLDWVTAEAVDHQGRVMGTSRVQRSKIPDKWGAAGFRGDLETLTPDDPAAPRPKSSTHPVAEEEAHRNVTSTPSPHPVDPETNEIAHLVHDTYDLVRNVSGVFVLVVLVGIVGGIAFSIYLLIVRWTTQSYRQVPAEDVPDEEVHLRSVD